MEQPTDRWLADWTLHERFVSVKHDEMENNQDELVRADVERSQSIMQQWERTYQSQMSNDDAVEQPTGDGSLGMYESQLTRYSTLNNPGQLLVNGSRFF